MSKIDADVDAKHVLLNYILNPLIRHNPFYNLYYNPLTGEVEKTIYSMYENYLHQITLYTDHVLRRPLRVFIGDEVGLGKTVEAIRLLKYLIEIGVARRILIIVPRSILYQWVYHDMYELLQAPRSITIITSKNIVNLLNRIDSINNSDEPHIFIGSMDLLKYGSMDARKGTRFKPYYEFVDKVKWDLIIIDEAHKLGFTPTGKRSLRSARLKPLCLKTPNVILLSATPSRGTHSDFLGRLTLVIPGLGEQYYNILLNQDLRDKFYRGIGELYFYRRMKDYVNMVEAKRVFTDLEIYMGLIKLGEMAKTYRELETFLAEIMDHIEKDAPILLHILLLKRAYSSPYSFLKTLVQVFTKRGFRVDERYLKILGEKYIDPDLVDEVYEKEVDAIISAGLHHYARRIPDKLLTMIEGLFKEFDRIWHEGDPGFKALQLILDTVAGEGVLQHIFHGDDYIVFSEYRDTVDYLFSKTIEYFYRKGFSDDHDLYQRIAYRALDSICSKARYRFCSEESLRKNMVDKASRYVKVLTRGDRYILLFKLSSENMDMVRIVKPFINQTSKLVKGVVRKIMYSTDVASEGLNLEEFNVVINYDIPWSPVRREQRIGRVYRLRQKRNCKVIDFVYESRFSLDIYTRLLSKLLNMVEQRVKPYGVEAVLLLKPYELVEKRAELIGLSEYDVSRMIVENYRSIVREKDAGKILERIYGELLEKVKELREVMESITQFTEPPENMPKRFEEIYGCRSHEEAYNALARVYELIYGVKPASRDLSTILVDVWKVLRNAGGLKLVGYIDSDLVEKGVITLISVVDEQGVSRYVSPVVYLKLRNGVEEHYIGLKALNWLVDRLLDKSLTIKLASRYTFIKDPDYDKLFDKIKYRSAPLISLFNYKLRSRVELLVKNGLEKLVEKQPVYQIVVDEENYIPINQVVLEEVAEQEPPEDLKWWMEEVSTEYVARLFSSKGCVLLEKHVHEKGPYDLLFECRDGGRVERYMVEVKSHWMDVRWAKLTAPETSMALKNPRNYIICIVSNLRESSEKWSVYCEVVEKIPRKILEKFLIVGF